MNNQISKTKLEGLLIIERSTFNDKRGFFREIFRLCDLEEMIGFKFNIVQANHARSLPRVIRALHAEGWNKLVYPVRGRIFSAVVDIREDSSTFGEYEIFDFDENSHKALFIPKGFANSICVVGDGSADYLYLVDSYYDGSDTGAVAWDDPDLKIPWPIKDPIISDRDKNNPKLRDLFPNKF